MAVAKTVQAQRDFSAGEIDLEVKRADQAQDTAAALKAGARQASNFRILNSKSLQNRPGRAALQFAASRLEEITILPGLVFRFEFVPTAGGTLNVYSTAGAVVAAVTACGWTAATIPYVRYALIRGAVYFAGPGMRPVVVARNDDGTWSGPTPFAALTTSGGQLRTFFYRISPRNVTMQPSATTGAITMAFSPAVVKFSAAMIGSLLRFCGRQIQVTGFTSTALLSGTVLESLPPGQILTAAADPRNLFSLGDEIVGQTSSARGLVTALTATLITVQLLQQNLSDGGATGRAGTSTIGFQSSEIVSGPGGSVTLTAAAITTTTPQAVSVWDDEVMNDFRGWPASLFADQSRLGFCNFPALPNAIGWSAIASPTDCYVDALASSAMLELAPDNVQVFDVVPGAESSEFVFCDRHIYYIPITPTNPLKPGSVAFQGLSGDGCAQIQPRSVQDVILYISAGSKSVMSVVATGAYNRPYETRNLSELHGHLIKSPIAIAVPGASSQFEERYAYVLNSDGTLAVGKYSMKSGQIDGSVGWVPWSGAGTVSWIMARDTVMQFVTSYFGVSILERLDNTLYLDGAISINSPPTALAPTIPGKGPLWWLANKTADLMDQTTRSMGTYTLDADGVLVPQNNAGENFTVATVIAGQAWTATLEPFVPAVQPGQDQLQRMRKRRIARAQIYVQNSTGFRLDTLQAEQQGASLPALGAAIRSRRISAWNQDDDPTRAPPLREQAYAFKPLGRAHDPRIALVKDTPGPLLVAEFGMEVSV